MSRPARCRGALVARSAGRCASTGFEFFLPAGKGGRAAGRSARRDKGVSRNALGQRRPETTEGTNTPGAQARPAVRALDIPEK